MFDFQVGEKFRSRALKFPGLISGCTINWFQKWPKDALIAVSSHFLKNFNIVCTPEVKYELIVEMGEVQDGVAVMCVTYFDRCVSFCFLRTNGKFSVWQRKKFFFCYF